MTRPKPFAVPRRGMLGLLPVLAMAACSNPDNQPQPIPTYTAPPPGLFQLSPGTPVDGRLRLTLVRGTGTARGVLNTTNGNRVPFTITGLATAGRAPARLDVVGDVYGLPRPQDFTGTYRDVGGPPSAQSELTGIPPANLSLGNDNLVLLRLRPARAGAADLTVTPGGATVSAGQ